MHELRCRHLELPERPVHLKFDYTGIVGVLCAETRHEQKCGLKYMNYDAQICLKFCDHLQLVENLQHDMNFVTCCNDCSSCLCDCVSAATDAARRVAAHLALVKLI